MNDVQNNDEEGEYSKCKFQLPLTYSDVKRTLPNRAVDSVAERQLRKIPRASSRNIEESSDEIADLQQDGQIHREVKRGRRRPVATRQPDPYSRAFVLCIALAEYTTPDRAASLPIWSTSVLCALSSRGGPRPDRINLEPFS